MRGSDPTAIITSHNSERKLYQGNTIYLNDGDNFEIRLFNPLSEKIGVEIRFNGQKKSNRLLVLNPGQDYILDRFIEEQRKMVFDTYLIDGDNSAAVAAAAQNGKVEILFHREKPYFPTWSTNVIYTTYNGTQGPTGPTYSSGSGYNTRGIVSSSLDSTKQVKMSKKLRSSSKSKSVNEEYLSFDGDLELEDSLVETGRIEKGDVSNQYFREVDVEFETYPFHTVTYWLKPASTMPRYTKEIRHYCPGCRTKIKDKYNYCPKCGFDLQNL